MFKVLPMKEGSFLSILRLFLTSIDVVVSLFLILGGGYIATSRSILIGGTSVILGFFLLYLSVGLWTNRRWKQLTRLCIYGLGSFVLLFAVAFDLFAEKQSLAEQFP